MLNLYPSSPWNREAVVEAFAKYTDQALLLLETPRGGQIISQFLADEVGWRVYTEWCMDASNDGGRQKWQSHRDYPGDALAKFLDDEKLWEAMDPKRGKHNTRSHEGEVARIADAFARSSIEFFRLHAHMVRGGRTDYFEVNEGDRTNIRRCLSPWLDNPKNILLVSY